MKIPFLNLELTSKGVIDGLVQKTNYLESIRYSPRPPLDILQQVGADGIRIPYYPLPPRSMYDIALYSDVLRTVHLDLKKEVMRNGIEIKPKFDSKCVKCEKEFEEKPEEGNCDKCGGELRAPDIDQKEILEKFIKMANENEQSLLDVYGQLEDDLNIMDDCFLVLVKNYIFDFEGNYVQSELKEIIRANPLGIRILADRKGRPGKNDDGKTLLTCVDHRTNLWIEGQHTKCPICNKQLFRADYKIEGYGADMQYFAQGEMIHASKYLPSLTYGFSPILSVWQKAITLLNQDKFMKDYYSKQRPPRGLFVVNTSNYASLQKSWETLLEQTRKNPHMFYPLAVEQPNGKKFAEFFDFMHTMTEMQFVEGRNEFRRAIGAVYGVMPLFQGDLGSSGGLNNEGLQITVTNRAVEMAQEVYNRKLNPKIAGALNVTDWELVLAQVEQQDVLRDLQIEAQKIANASSMKSLGFDVTMDEEGEFEFHESQAPQMPQPPADVSPKPVQIVQPTKTEGMPANIRKGDDDVEWRTINGKHIPFKNGKPAYGEGYHNKPDEKKPEESKPEEKKPEAPKEGILDKITEKINQWSDAVHDSMVDDRYHSNDKMQNINNFIEDYSNVNTKNVQQLDVMIDFALDNLHKAFKKLKSGEIHSPDVDATIHKISNAANSLLDARSRPDDHFAKVVALDSYTAYGHENIPFLAWGYFGEGLGPDGAKKIKFQLDQLRTKNYRTMEDAAVTSATPGVYNPTANNRKKRNESLMKMLFSERELVEKELDHKIVLKADTEDKVGIIQDALYSKRFEGMTGAESNKIRDRIIDAINNRDSLETLIKALLKAVPKLDEPQAEAIARTEMHNVRMNLRAFTFNEDDPEDHNLYKWIGPDDNRTTPICKEITKRCSKGVKLSELKKIIKEEGKDLAREYTPHPNCRHVMVRHFGE